MSYLDVQELEKSYDSRRALAGMSFAVDRGEVYGLVGPNGAGKTTAINIICGLVKPDGGRVELEGEPVGDRAPIQIGIASQEVALYRDLTCKQNLEFFGALYGLRGRQLADRVASGLRVAALEDRSATLVANLSGGMQRRLHIAVAMLHQPTLLILDEPTVGLDLEARHHAWEMIRGVQQEGRAVFLTTHHLVEAERLSSRIGIVAGGRIVAEGSMDELRALLPAAELAVIEAEDLTAVRRRAVERELRYREESGAIAVWLPTKAELDDVAGYFHGIPLRSLTLKPVSLEEVYAEVTRHAS